MNIWQTVNAFKNYFSDFEAFLIALLKGESLLAHFSIFGLKVVVSKE
jgi:hypothetical protein